ncbi:hypothetical protein GCM10010330_41620 [Streptomyces tendae]|nr:hypothetical protein GCM10010330_41620 [Streptomyces tendae]
MFVSGVPAGRVMVRSVLPMSASFCQCLSVSIGFGRRVVGVLVGLGRGVGGAGVDVAGRCRRLRLPRGLGLLRGWGLGGGGLGGVGGAGVMAAWGVGWRRGAESVRPGPGARVRAGRSGGPWPVAA